MSFTTALRDLGFTSAGESWEGHQHRWVRDDAQIDVLIPRHVGQRAASRQGITGGTTLETPGAQAALERAEPIQVRLHELTGIILRPTLQGAIAAKSAAYTVVNDRHRDRHLTDLIVLSTLVTPLDHVADGLTRTERARILAAIRDMESRPGIIETISGGREGIARLKLALS